jgi:hypothetical protein
LLERDHKEKIPPPGVGWIMARWGFMGCLIVALLLAGCMGGTPNADPPPDNRGGDGTADPEGTWQIPAPLLAQGRSWTYTASGFWEIPSEITIVVARADTSGYLLAGGTREELQNEVIWDVPYFGERDLALEPVGARDRHNGPMLVFPIAENRTWEFRGTNVFAQRAEIEVMGRTLDGVRIHGTDGGFEVLIEYAPEVGYITRYRETWGTMGLAWSLELASVGERSDWAWFELGAEVFMNSMEEPVTLEVTDEEEAVIIWWIGDETSRGIVAPPPGGPLPFLHEGQGSPRFVAEIHDAVPGAWRFAGIQGDEEGFVYYQAHALRWVSP